MSKNLSIRKARLEFRGRFIKAIDEFKTVAILCDYLHSPNDDNMLTLGPLLTSLPDELIRHIFSLVLGNSVADRHLIGMCWSPLSLPINDQPRFRIAVRKRSLWDFENPKFFDTMTVNTVRRRCVLHDSRLDRSHQTFSYHREFALDHHFDEVSTNQEVFIETVKPLLDRAMAGEKSTFCAFGQTGTGKTHTVHGMENAVAESLFTEYSQNSSTKSSLSAAPVINEFEIDVMSFEIRGNQCYDLLNDGCKVKLMHSADGSVEVVGARHVIATSQINLMEAFQAAHKLRATKATERNDHSSRSHSITKLIIKTKQNHSKEDGCLTLVDLAGSERNEDTCAVYDAESARESASINASLMTLKDCFRAMSEKDYEQEVVVELRDFKGSLVSVKKANHSNTLGNGFLFGGNDVESNGDLRTFPKETGAVERIVTRAKEGGALKDMLMPFRDSLLTTFLKDAFMNPHHRTVVVACVSPTPHDVEHTRRTLELVCSMRGTSDVMTRSIKVGETSATKVITEVEKVNKWSEKRMKQWIDEFNKNKNIKFKLPPRCDGKAFLRLGVPRLASCCGGNKVVAQLAFKSIRDEIAMQNKQALKKRKQFTDLLYGEAKVKGKPLVKRSSS